MPVVPVATGDVTVAVDGPVVLVTFARPAKRNALTQAMYATVADTLAAADADPATAAVVLTGTGPAFTAGNDLGEFASGTPLDEVTRFLAILASVTVPVIAAVNGTAVGVGLTMLLHCDFVYVEPDAALAAPFVELGLVPEAGSSLLLPRLVGGRRASEVLLAGRSLTGAEAARWGLATAVASPTLDAALDTARRLACRPPLALRATKRLLRTDDAGVEARMQLEMGRFAEALAGPEFAEVLAARSEGRPPRFGPPVEPAAGPTAAQPT